MGRFRTLYLPFALVFLSGTVVGGFSYHLYTQSNVKADTRSGPEDFRRRYVEEMRTRLSLDAEQIKKLNGILDETRVQYRAFNERHKDELKIIQDGQVARVNTILSAAQQAEYVKLREERERRRKERDQKGAASK